VWSATPETAMQVFAPLDDEEPATVLDLRPVLPTMVNGIHTG
jgi:hypothetical protein